jgi:hypothetical protein
MSVFTRFPAELYPCDAFAGFVGGADFALADGRALAWLSQLAYETDDPGKVAGILAGWGLSPVAGGIIVEDSAPVLPRASTRCIVADGPQGTFVAFTGTDPLVFANWITNLDARLGADGIARGFNAAAQVVWPRLRPLIADAATAGRQIFLSGHSLGGVLAVLTALRLSDEGVAGTQAVYTFGMPRAGGGVFAQAYNARFGARTFRLVHGLDIVPTLGPSGLGFRHVGRHLHCPRGTRFCVDRLAVDTDCDEPQFIASALHDFAAFWREPRARVIEGAARFRTAAELAAGRGPAGMRTDPVGISHELLPARIRDHLPERYTGGFAAPVAAPSPDAAATA